MKHQFSGPIFEKYSNIQHHKPSKGSRVVSCGQTDRRTDMTKLTVTFRDFTNAPKSTNFNTRIKEV
jgi:hypothetical protein